MYDVAISYLVQKVFLKRLTAIQGTTQPKCVQTALIPYFSMLAPVESVIR
jgi:hypothetical protein